jgi:magnesium chelatase family protein
LAHGGVLFLDELPEFRSEALETLRQPMEDRRLTLVRAGVSYEFPADFMLVAAMNPCRCGYYPDRNLCHCTEREVRAYLSRISRPLLDRMDICTEVHKVTYQELNGSGETSAVIRQRVAQVAAIQKERFSDTPILWNARIPADKLDQYCPMDEPAERLLARIYEKMTLSTRGLHSIRRIARTIADMEGEDVIRQRHISEAVFYRGPRDQFWGGV